MMKKKKKIIFGLFSLILCFCLIVCSIDTENDDNSNNESIKVIGVYYNEDDKTVNPEDGVERNWINVVYEINNQTDENWKDDFFWSSDSNTLTIGSNDYEYDKGTDGLAILYGFSVPSKNSEIWAGAKLTYLVRFVVNQSDIKKEMEGKFKVEYNGKIYTYEFNYDDLTPYTEETMIELSKNLNINKTK